MDLLLGGLALDDVADLAPPGRPAAKDVLGLSHAALLPIPAAVVDAAGDVLGRLAFDQDGGELVADEEDVVGNLQLSDDCVG